VRRPAIIVTSVIAAVLVAGVVVITVPGRSGPGASLPSSDAAAPTVARAFLDAAVRRDCHAMRALSSPVDTNWCPASLYGRWMSGDPTMHDWTTLRAVSAARDPEQCFEYGMHESGVTGMSPGAMTFGLCLRHHPEGWRVSEEGVG
jgi:hypothetical protein